MDTLPLIAELPKDNLPTCAQCGKPIIGRRKDALYCADKCMRYARRYRYERKRGTPLDKVERECVVCGMPFVSRRYSQLYCGKPCLRHVINGRRTAKNRKTDEPPRVSPQLVYRRAAAIRAKKPRPPASFPLTA